MTTTTTTKRKKTKKWRTTRPKWTITRRLTERVLVPGGSSYVAQFVLQRHLTAAQSKSGDATNFENSYQW